MYTSSRTLWTAFKEAIGLYRRFGAPVNLLGAVRRNERNRSLCVEGLREEIGAREPIHVARHRQTEEVQERGRDIDDRPSALARSHDRRAVRQQETVRAALVRAAELRIASHAFEHPLTNRERLHPEA